MFKKRRSIVSLASWRLVGLVLMGAGATAWGQSPEAPTAQNAEYERQRDALYQAAEQAWLNGDYAAAEKAGQQVLAIERKWLGEDSPEVATTIELLAELHEDAEDWPKARQRRDEVLAWHKQHSGADHWQTADARLAIRNLEQFQSFSDAQREQLYEAWDLDAQVIALDEQGDFERAIAFAQRSLEIKRKVAGKNHPWCGSSLHDLAVLCDATEQYPRAESLCRQALEIGEQAYGKKHPEYARLLALLASLCDIRGDIENAKELQEQALQICKQTLGEEDHEYATMLNGRGLILWGNEEIELAQQSFRQALAVYKKIGDDQHIDYATTLDNLGSTLADQGDNEQAIELFNQSLAIQRVVYEQQPDELSFLLRDFAEFYESIDQPKDAAPLYREALELDKQSSGGDTADYAMHLNTLGELYRELEEFEKAVAHHKQALAIRAKLLGEDHVDYTTSLNNLALTHEQKGEYELAEPLYIEALDTRERVLGDGHEYVAFSRNNLALYYSGRGVYTKAGPLYEKVAEYRRQAFGPEHTEYADSLNYWALNFYRLGKYSRAEELYEQALTVQRKALGERHESVGLLLNNLGLVHVVTGRFAKAEQTYQLALEISREALGERHPRCALVLINQANMYATQARYDKAEPLCKLAVEIRREAFGEQHLDYARGLDSLVQLYTGSGAYGQAESWCRRSLEIKRTVVGESHPSFATTLSELSSIYARQGKYAKAEQLCRQSLQIRKRLLGAMHPYYADSLNSLGMLLVSSGDYAQAEPLFRTSLDIRRQAYGEASAIVSASWSNLGFLYQQTKDYDQAEEAYLQALNVILKTFDQRHPSYATMLNNLATLYMSRTSTLEKGGDRCREVVMLRKEVLGEEHPDYALALKNLAFYHSMRGDYAKAAELNRAALDVWLRALGENHTNTAVALSDLGYLSVLTGDSKSAAELLGRASDIHMRNLRETFAVQTERQKLLLLNKSRAYLDGWLTVAGAADVSPSEIYDRILLWKGIVFTDQQRQQLVRRDSKLDDELKALRAVTRKLAAASLAVPSTAEDRRNRSNELALLTTEKERLERNLALQSSAFREQQQAEQVTSSELTASLPKDTALIDFLVYDHILQPFKGSRRIVSEKRLLAFVCRSSGEVERVDLGPLEPIETLIKKWRRQVRYAVAMLGDRHPGIELKESVWQPLQKHLAGADVVLISPDGPLCRLAFAALPGETADRFLIEQRTIAVVPVPQLLPQLLGGDSPTDAQAQANASLVLVGDVNYGGSPGEVESEQAIDRSGLATNLRAAIDATSDERGASLASYGHLSGTRAEIDQLARTFERSFPNQPVTVLDRDIATEAALRTHAPRCSWLHMATHGFFAPSRLQRMLAPPDIRREEHTSLFDSGGVAAFHPGLLSGIVLTGANREPTADQDDGILTALEVAALDLRGIQLAVLSACETGLGEESGGEGLLGLQRAFQAAGARTVISSLWRVPDEQTSVLMQRFYRNIWIKKMSKIAALRDAQLFILQGNDVDREEVPPEHWAAFTLSGDWR